MQGEFEPAGSFLDAQDLALKTGCPEREERCRDDHDALQKRGTEQVEQRQQQGGGGEGHDPEMGDLEKFLI